MGLTAYGVDPGLAAAGLAAVHFRTGAPRPEVRFATTIRTPAGLTVEERVVRVLREVAGWVPAGARLGVEEVQHGRFEGVAASGPLLYQIRGGLVRLADEKGVDLDFIRVDKWHGIAGVQSPGRGLARRERERLVKINVANALRIVVEGTDGLTKTHEWDAVGVAYAAGVLALLQKTIEEKTR